MRRAPLVLLSVLLVAGLASLASAQGPTPPASAHSLMLDAGGVTVSHWLGTQDAVATGLNASETGGLWLAMNATTPENGTSPATQRAYLNLSSSDLVFGTPALVLTLDAAASGGWAFANTTVMPGPNATGNATYSFTVEVYREDPNGTSLLLGRGDDVGSFAVLVPAPPVEPPAGIPRSYLVGGGAAVVVGGAAALYAMRQRREKRIMNQAPRRSQVMREMELERQLEKVEEKEPERAAEIKQEIRAQEVVREKRRELQILEAKRADAIKTMDLLQKRHETGGLTKLQYDNMVKKKQVDLERIEAEIAQMEAEDAAGGAAA